MHHRVTGRAAEGVGFRVVIRTIGTQDADEEEEDPRDNGDIGDVSRARNIEIDVGELGDGAETVAPSALEQDAADEQQNPQRQEAGDDDIREDAEVGVLVRDREVDEDQEDEVSDRNDRNDHTDLAHEIAGKRAGL